MAPVALSVLIDYVQEANVCSTSYFFFPPLAARRFAQYAFIRFPIAAFSAALHTCRFGLGFDLAFCFGLSLG